VLCLGVNVYLCVCVFVYAEEERVESLPCWVYIAVARSSSSTGKQCSRSTIGATHPHEEWVHEARSAAVQLCSSAAACLEREVSRVIGHDEQRELGEVAVHGDGVRAAANGLQAPQHERQQLQGRCQVWGGMLECWVIDGSGRPANATAVSLVGSITCMAL